MPARSAKQASDFDGRLLAAAMAVVSEHGLTGLTLARLAEELSGSRMTRHRRGVTRDGVSGRLALLAVEEYQQAVWPALTAPGDAAERLSLALHATCAVADRHAKLLVGLFADDGGIFHDTDSSLAGGQAAPVDTRAVFVEPLARLLRDGASDASLSCHDPDEMATVLFNQVGWTFLALRAGQHWTPERAADVVVGNALACVKGDRKGEPSAAGGSGRTDRTPSVGRKKVGRPHGGSS